MGVFRALLIAALALATTTTVDGQTSDTVGATNKSGTPLPRASYGQIASSIGGTSSWPSNASEIDNTTNLTSNTSETSNAASAGPTVSDISNSTSVISNTSETPNTTSVISNFSGISNTSSAISYASETLNITNVVSNANDTSNSTNMISNASGISDIINVISNASGISKTSNVMPNTTDTSNTNDVISNSSNTSNTSGPSTQEDSTQLGPNLIRLYITATCDLTLGSWCRNFLEQPPNPVRPPPRGNKSCSRDCNFVGSCNYDTGWQGDTCKGDTCEIRMKRPCTNRIRDSMDKRSSYNEPVSHIDPVTKADLNWSKPGWTASRCAGYCDDDIAQCYCGGDSKYRRIPAVNNAPPNTPIQAVRTLGVGVKPGSDASGKEKKCWANAEFQSPTRERCKWQEEQAGRTLSVRAQPGSDASGKKNKWGRAQVTYDMLYGPQGWCNADNPKASAYLDVCTLDNLGGPFCNISKEAYCPNQCTAHGACLRGFCKCYEGWYGADCSRQRAGVDADADLAGDYNSHPWLKSVVVSPPASLDPPSRKERKRPYIYYSMSSLPGTPPCVWRNFDIYNISTFPMTTGGYYIETALHEMLLASPHRTFDPEEADFFYVPVYITCYAWPVYGWADFPWFYTPDIKNRPMHMANMMLEAKDWLQRYFPWWDRRQGRDHIWLAAHDEGACYMPSSIYNSSIVFSHWGRLGMDHKSNSGYVSDNYSKPMDRMPEYQHYSDWRQMYKGHPCYDPVKDLLVPGFKTPLHFHSSPLLSGVAKPRDILLYFRGDVGLQRKAQYSRGIRQKYYKLYMDEWRARYPNILIGAKTSTQSGDYSSHLSRSIFCLAAPGDGYAMRVEDAVLHGCLPVIVMDDVHAVLESVIDYSQFSVRIKESEIERTPEILLDITPQEIEGMQRALAKVWTRFVYTGIVRIKESEIERSPELLLAITPQEIEGMQRALVKVWTRFVYKALCKKDAMATIMGWLYSRINATR
eukprot:gene7380-504_t